MCWVDKLTFRIWTAANQSAKDPNYPGWRVDRPTRVCSRSCPRSNGRDRSRVRNSISAYSQGGQIGLWWREGRTRMREVMSLPEVMTAVSKCLATMNITAAVPNVSFSISTLSIAWPQFAVPTCAATASHGGSQHAQHMPTLHCTCMPVVIAGMSMQMNSLSDQLSRTMHGNNTFPQWLPVSTKALGDGSIDHHPRHTPTSRHTAAAVMHTRP